MIVYEQHYAGSPVRTRDDMPWWLIFGAWLVASTSTLGALFFGEVMNLPTCVLCWYQRIFMFPLALVLPIGMFPFDRKVVRYALPLAALGWLFAAFHVLLVAGVIPEERQALYAGGAVLGTGDRVVRIRDDSSAVAGGVLRDHCVAGSGLSSGLQMKKEVLFVVVAVGLFVVFLFGTLAYKSEQKAQTAQVAERNRENLVRMHSPTLGRDDAPVVIVEFLDPACGTCREFYPLVKQMMAANPDRIRLVLRYAPFHDGSEQVVAVLEAARRQGKFWPALEALLARQAEWVHRPQGAGGPGLEASRGPRPESRAAAGRHGGPANRARDCAGS